MINTIYIITNGTKGTPDYQIVAATVNEVVAVALVSIGQGTSFEAIPNTTAATLLQLDEEEPHIL